MWVGLTFGGLVSLVGLAFLPHGYDLVAYWTVDPFDPYRVAGEYGAFRYAPPLALLFAPLGLLPWEVVTVVCLGLQLAALWYIGRRWALALVLFPPVWQDLAFGNVYVFLGAMIVAGWRYPGAWAFGLLAKVTPGIGLVWLAVRRDWRALGWAAGATLALILVSLAIQGPSAWADWIAMLGVRNQLMPPDALPIPLVPRLAVAFLLVGYGALTDRRWTVPVAVCLAMPTLWVISFAPLIAMAGSGPARASRYAGWRAGRR